MCGLGTVYRCCSAVPAYATIMRCCTSTVCCNTSSCARIAASSAYLGRLKLVELLVLVASVAVAAWVAGLGSEIARRELGCDGDDHSAAARGAALHR